MKIMPMATLLMATLSGCSVLGGTANRFESNSVLGYVPPINSANKAYDVRKGEGGQPIQNPNVIPSSVDGKTISKGDCLVVDMVGGYVNQSFETSLEKLFSSRTRNEITIAVAAYERTDSTIISKKTDERYPSSAEYNIFSTMGQLARRPFSFENVPIYGPRRYEGGDMVFHLSMVEQDEKEAEALKTDITNQTKEISKSLPEDSRNISVHNAVLKAMTDATFTLSGVGLVAVGVSAVEMFADAYSKINKEDDLIINHTFSLVSANRSPELHSPILRIGYFPIVRLSTKEDYPNGLVNAVFDPIAPSLKMGKPLDEPMWVALRVSKTNSCK